MSVAVEGTCDVWEINHRKARKQHECAACHETIPIGHVYANHFSVFEGTAETVKRCMRCELIYQHLCSIEEDPDFSPAQRLDCGHSYEENWCRPPPDHVAKLAFMTPEEIQLELAKEQEKGMRTHDCKDGMKVMYAPVLNDPLEFAGVVDGEPWQLCGQWVVNLKQMQPEYGKWRGQPERTRVNAAALTNLRQVDES
jgi:hypothetical protein